MLAKKGYKEDVIKKNNQQDEWTKLAVAAQDGDKHAYNALLTALAPYVRNVVIKSLSSQDAAEDIAQEVLISVHKSLHTYSAERPFKPWLMAIINFRKMDYLRKHYAGRQDKMSSVENNPEFIAKNVTNATHQGELKDIEAALSQLPEQQQRIFSMIKIEGYTTKEVANEMKMNESAVKVSAHRTMKKLQVLLKGED